MSLIAVATDDTISSVATAVIQSYSLSMTNKTSIDQQLGIGQ